ncbi:hypothetical protein SAMN07250955_101319 [Arboricoccus pini]|uniref:Uncharacterized protein n=2 Tax=Arboricoccus pini TaxID=1963835 RepID=A0A212Q1F3_9PROT|nr:hypothetical protein SAMN07250955_101319 [Arboricoccus pini]
MTAARLTRDLRYKSWLECARAIDRFIMGEAKARLDLETIRLIKDRRPRDAAHAAIIDRWVDDCLTILRSVLARLESEAEGPLAGILSLSPVENEERAQIKERLGALSHDDLLEALAAQRGHALLVLALVDSDNAASLIAREMLLA